MKSVSPEVKPLTPFDFINSINQTKVNLLDQDPANIKQYNAFIINRGLSYFYDTLMPANEMNLHADLAPEVQYQFLLNVINKRKRWSKWYKAEPDTEEVVLVADTYKVSKQRAREMLPLLTTDQLSLIKQLQFRGGMK